MKRQSIWVIATFAWSLVSAGQELEPRAYSISPVGVNFLVAGTARSSGDINFDPAIPVDNARSTLHGAFLAYGRSINMFGRSGSAFVTVPYVWGSLSGDVNGIHQEASRSGLANPALRVSVNLFGAPAMDLLHFAQYRQRTNIGASLVVVAPLGQYDPARLVNIGTNRWAAKPEIGLSRRFGRWYLDAYLGAWLFSANNNFRGDIRKQDPIVSTQAHVSYNLSPRLWAAFDANFYTGGTTSVNGVARTDLQRNSRLGGTVSLPVSGRHAIKVTASTGAVTSIGADFVSIGIAYQYLWGGGL